MKALWQNTIIAESNDTVVVEGNHYFPIDALEASFLENSPHTTVCPWKGTAHYFTLNVNGTRNINAAWFYPEPKDAAAQIKGRIAFWKGVSVVS